MSDVLTRSPRLEPSAQHRAKEDAGVSARLPWRRPQLTRFGDLRQLTMGPSPGSGESANPAVFRP